MEANIKRWQNLFKDDDGNPPRIETKKVKGKNVEVMRAETHGEYHPAQFPGGPARAGPRRARACWARSSRPTTRAITSAWSAPTRP